MDASKGAGFFCLTADIMGIADVTVRAIRPRPCKAYLIAIYFIRRFL